MADLAYAEYEKLVLQAVCGNHDAADFCITTYSIMHCWDDLIDKDKPVDPEAINLAFWQVLVVLPRNRFYQRHFDCLNPLFMTMIQNWHAANAMEKNGTDADLEIAFIIRSGCVDLLIQAATLVGGYSHAREVTPLIHRIAHSDGLAGFKANLAKQFADAAELAQAV
jgi:hypothetical protein